VLFLKAPTDATHGRTTGERSFYVPRSRRASALLLGQLSIYASCLARLDVPEVLRSGPICSLIRWLTRSAERLLEGVHFMFLVLATLPFCDAGSCWFIVPVTPVYSFVASYRQGSFVR
jgi:hypothetical protein